MTAERRARVAYARTELARFRIEADRASFGPSRSLDWQGWAHRLANALSNLLDGIEEPPERPRTGERPPRYMDPRTHIPHTITPADVEGCETPGVEED